MPTTDEIFAQLRQVFDPEIPVNIVDLGLVYGVELQDSTAKITMTLTSKFCPEAQSIPDVMKRRCNSIDGVEDTQIEIVWEPAWTPQMITPEGRKLLGMEDEGQPADAPEQGSEGPAGGTQ